MASLDNEEHYFLQGGCTCERNQYTIYIPPNSVARAQVYFDNSVANRRAQASPLTAWLRVPLSWYHSATIAHFPDESHGSIKRTFTHPTDVRRQFCGYCGTHLTAWDEVAAAAAAAAAAVAAKGITTQVPDKSAPSKGARDALDGAEAEWLDVTMGSLSEESLERLEGLGLVGAGGEESDEGSGDEETEDEDEDEGEPDVEAGDSKETPDHNTTSATPAKRRGRRRRTTTGTDDGREMIGARASAIRTSARSAFPHAGHAHRMRNRGVPFFEAMVDGSRLGRIRRQVRGARRSADGRTTVRWEVIEVDDGAAVVVEDALMSDVGTNGDGEEASGGSSSPSKRVKLSG